MNLYIKKIVIEKNSKTTENYEFNKKLSVVRAGSDLYDVIKLIVGKHEAGHTFYNVKFSAEVVLDKTYYIRGAKNKGEQLFDFAIFTKGEVECTEEYFEVIKINKESDSSLFFHRFKRQDYPHKLFRYRDLFKYYPDGDFSLLTNGYGTTRSFRGFMAQYIKHFKPIKLYSTKNLNLKISKDGEFNVGYLNNDEKVCLSMGENTLYHYLSFISIADFWDRADKIRNMHSIKKPLIISSLFERLDESVNIDKILRKTNLLSRQTIIFVSKEIIPTKYDV